jgi:serine/threonine protein kinase
MCPTCGARYVLPEYKEGQRYGCKRCSASLLFGKFALLQELGRGGFGVVYKAWQADLQRVVALKFLQSDSQESTDRFIREARIAANLAHPNITPIYEVGEHEGKLYITMLFVDGTTTNKTRFSLQEAAQVIRNAALAVDYAHARSIIHRDIKPHNIMVTREEASGTNPGEMSRRVYVMDFGLARSVGKGGTLTTEGQILGTPAFMSPEQAEGKTLDSKTDVYSLGATLYSLVAQRAPFEANTPVQVLMLVATGTPVPPRTHNPEIDPNLEGIIMKAMARKPEDRYPTAARMAQDLSRWLSGGVTDAGPTVQIPSQSFPSTPVAKKKSRALPLAIGLLLILVGAAGLLKMFVLGPKGEKSDPGSAEQAKRDPSPGDPAPGTGPPPAVSRVVLEVRTEPAGARVRVGPLEPRESPCEFKEIDLALGDYDVEITKATYEPVVKRVSIQEGRKASVNEKLVKAKRAVAFRLDTVPSGAKVILEGSEVGSTKLVVYRDQLPRDVDRVNVVVELRGYKRQGGTIEIQGSEHEERIVLEPETGTLVIREALPRSRIYVFGLPAGMAPKSPRALCSLWSENGDSLEKALDTLDPADAPLVVERLRILGGHQEARIRDRAAKLVVANAAPVPFRPEATLAADGAGNALYEKAWIENLYRVLATSPATSDFVSDELQPIKNDETRVKAVMAAIASVSARVRPPEGHFILKYGDGSQPVQIVPGGQAVRIPAGPITLRFVPPPTNPFLREFVIADTASERYELTGNLYLLSAKAMEKADPAGAIRIYTKVLEETTWPQSEDEERKRLPPLVTGMIRTTLAVQEAKGATVADPAQVLDAASKQAPADAVRALLEVWCAKDAPRAAKAGAAALLALDYARLKRPYESMEWFERTIALGMDPGLEIEGAVTTAVRNFPGLGERLEPATRTVAAMRQAALRKPGFLGVKVVEVIGRGVRVEAVSKGGPAEAAGLQFGDILLELGGAALKVPADLDDAMKTRGEGDDLEVKYERTGEKKIAVVRLAPVPATAPEFVAPPPAPTRLGVLQVLSPQFGHIVKLDAATDIKAGDALEVLRKGEVVAELIATRTTRPDSSYPSGSIVCRLAKGTPQKGDEVRKKP